MAAWRLDEGLTTFRSQWWAKHSKAIVYTIGDGNHSTNPRVTQHAPDDGESGGPGDTPGEVDAVDVMPGNGVDDDDLTGLFNDLVDSRDPRILMVIYGQTIVSSVVQPWKRRKYTGKKHGHVHLSVNDLYSANTRPWKIGDAVPAPPLIKEEAGFPSFTYGDEDSRFTGYDGIKRFQVMCNWKDATLPDLDVDGVYGANTARKIARVMAGHDPSTPNGRKIGMPEHYTIMGVYRV